MAGQYGRYEVRGTLGSGGMATVYRGWDPRFQREVAIKVISGSGAELAISRARFEREARAIAALEHHAIVPVYDFGEEGGESYIVMRLMGGGSLADRIRRGPMAVGDLAPVLQRVAQALDHAHSRGVIHRDVKPGNILFDASGSAFLSDFGIARELDQTSSLTGTGLLGSPRYMAPEQVEGKPASPASDIYSLGVTAYEALAGAPPFIADNPLAVMMMHLRNDAPSLREVRPDLPRDVVAAVERAMHREPEARFVGAGTFWLAVRDSESPSDLTRSVATVALTARGAMPQPDAKPSPLNPKQRARGSQTQRSNVLLGPTFAARESLGDVHGTAKMTASRRRFLLLVGGGIVLAAGGGGYALTKRTSDDVPISEGDEGNTPQAETVRALPPAQATSSPAAELSTTTTLTRATDTPTQIPTRPTRNYAPPIEDRSKSVTFGVESAAWPQPRRLHLVLYFRNDGSASAAWTSDVGDTRIAVTTPEGDRYSSVAVGGDFARDIAGGIPPGAKWYGWHEFVLDEDPEQVVLSYPGRVALTLLL